MTMERELCDEQAEAAHREMHERPQKEGVAGYIDPRHVEPHHREFLEQTGRDAHLDKKERDERTGD